DRLDVGNGGQVREHFRSFPLLLRAPPECRAPLVATFLLAHIPILLTTACLSSTGRPPRTVRPVKPVPSVPRRRWAGAPPAHHARRTPPPGGSTQPRRTGTRAR